MTPQILLQLAIGLHLRGDYAGARAHCERALALSQASEELTSDLLDVLGSTQRDAGDLASARVSYGKALEIRRRLFGYESVQVATTLSNLGVVEHRGGRNAEAIALLSPAVMLLVKEHGERHAEVARAGVNLAIAHAAAGNLDQARALFQLAVTTFQATLGENHPDTGRAIDGLATVHLLTGDREEARRLLMHAVDIFSATLGPHHPHTEGSRAKLSQVDPSLQSHGRSFDDAKDSLPSTPEVGQCPCGSGRPFIECHGSDATEGDA